MKATTVELALSRWPYGLVIQPSANGLLLRPRRKARIGWAKAFRDLRPISDEIAPVRQFSNQFDAEEWQW